MTTKETQSTITEIVRQKASKSIVELVQQALRDGKVADSAATQAKQNYNELHGLLRMEGKRLEGWDVYVVPRLANKKEGE